MIYSNSQRDPENVRIVMIVIVLDWDFTCLSFWVAVATVSEGQFTVSLLKSQGFFTYFWHFLTMLALSKRTCGVFQATKLVRLDDPVLAPTQFHQLRKALVSLLVGGIWHSALDPLHPVQQLPTPISALIYPWETLSSSLAPHLIGILDTFSSLAPSWPLNSSVKTYK